MKSVLFFSYPCAWEVPQIWGLRILIQDQMSSTDSVHPTAGLVQPLLPSWAELSRGSVFLSAECGNNGDSAHSYRVCVSVYLCVRVCVSERERQREVERERARLFKVCEAAEKVCFIHTLLTSVLPATGKANHSTPLSSSKLKLN